MGTDDEFAVVVDARLNTLRDQHAAFVDLANASHAAIRRATLTILLEERDAFPLRTRIRIDDMAEECLQRYDAFTLGDDPDAADAIDVIDAIDAVADAGDAGGDVADDANHNNRSGIRIRLVSLLDGYEMPSWLTELGLTLVENDTHDMLCDQNIGANYRGLDSTRDTVKEVKAILRIFPGVLSKRKETVWVEDEVAVGWRWVAAQNVRQGDFPIHCLLRVYGGVGYQCNFKAAPFIIVLAQVAIQFGLFEENERGGLLYEYHHDTTTLYNLVEHSFSVYSEQLIQLKQMNLFTKEDVRGQALLLYWHHYAENKFNESRFRWLVEWDPTSLDTFCRPLHELPLHLAAQNSTVQGFRFVFEFYIRYYPKKKGLHLLFTKNGHGRTAFELACNKNPLQHDELRSIVETTLDNSDQPLNIVDALVTAAISERVHLDCVYTLFRRNPVTVVNALLLGLPNNNNNELE